VLTIRKQFAIIKSSKESIQAKSRKGGQHGKNKHSGLVLLRRRNIRLVLRVERPGKEERNPQARRGHQVRAHTQRGQHVRAHTRKVSHPAHFLLRPERGRPFVTPRSAV